MPLTCCHPSPIIDVNASEVRLCLKKKPHFFLNETWKQIIRLNCSGNEVCELDLWRCCAASSELGNLRAWYGRKEELRNTALARRDGVRRTEAQAET